MLAFHQFVILGDANRLKQAKLFPGNPRSIRRTYDKILDGAGLPASRRDKFHKLRRTVASHIAAEKGLHAASEYLGHQSILTTKRYVDPMMLPDADMSDVLEGMLPDKGDDK